MRRFSTKAPNIWKSPIGKWRATPKGVAGDSAVVATQGLRQAIASGGSSDEAAANSTIGTALLDFLSQLKSPPTASHVRLIRQALDRIPEQPQASHLQTVYRSVVGTDAGHELATQLYVSLFHNAKLSAADRLHNGLLYYQLLLRRDMVGEARSLVAAVLRDNWSAVGPNQILEFVDVTVQTHLNASLLVAIVSASTGLATGTNIKSQSSENNQVQHTWSDIVVRVVKILCDRVLIPEPSAQAELTRLVDNLVFVNPHLELGTEILVVFLDALMDRHVPEMGRKLLHASLSKLLATGSLEHAELCLLCCMHFGDRADTGRHIAAVVRQFPESALVKETWDALVQWSAYSGGIPELTAQVEQMRRHGCEPDSVTLHGVLEVVAQQKRPPRELDAIVHYFNNDLRVDCDAAAYAVLIRRSLQAVEVEQARQLFIDSSANGADWNMDNGRYLDVLNDLLIALCQASSTSGAPIVEPRWVIDTYERVRNYTLRVSYSAQIELLRQFLDLGDISAISLFIVQQFGETPALPYETYRAVYDAFYGKIMAITDFDAMWDLYGVLNSTVVLPYESYYPFQQRFCEIGRPDAAHLMFRHLRNRAKRGDVRPPGREMYLMLFAQYGRFRYEEGIRELDTYFRMDLNNDMDIELMNRMLLAYAGLEDVPRMANLWLETLGFPRGHGANNETMDIMLAHFTQQLSLEAVDDLWEEFPERFGVAPSPENVRRYVIANCYHGYYMRAFDIVKASPELYGVPVSPELLETVYNWSMIPSRKNQIEQWALENHPDIWNSLVVGKSLKNHILPPNPDNDSEASLRAQTIAKIQAEEDTQVPQVTRRTDDEI